MVRVTRVFGILLSGHSRGLCDPGSWLRIFVVMSPLTVPKKCITGSGTTAMPVPVFTSFTVPVYVSLFVCLGVTVLPLLPVTVYSGFIIYRVQSTANSFLEASKHKSPPHLRELPMVGRKQGIVPFASKPQVTKRLH